MMMMMMMMMTMATDPIGVFKILISLETIKFY